jgi:hypothetical protein
MTKGADMAILEIPLNDYIRVSDLQTFLSGIDKLYFKSLWLDLASASPAGRPFPDYYNPTDEEDLWIAELQIGTPNRIKLRGKRNSLAQVARFVTWIAAVTAGGVPSDVHARDAFVRSELAQTQFTGKAQQLFAQKRISRDALQHASQGLADEVKDSITTAPAVVPLHRPTFRVSLTD